MDAPAQLVILFVLVHTLMSALPSMATSLALTWCVATHPALKKPLLEPLRALMQKLANEMEPHHRRARTFMGGE